MSPRLLRPRILLLLSFCAAAPALIVCAGGAPPAKESPTPQTPASALKLPEVEKLLAKQKLSEADQALDRAIADARAKSNDALLAYALIGKTQVQTALGGYETAVRDLRAAAWPQAGIPRTVLELYFGHALTNYVVGYGWEIGQREKVDSKAEVDLKSWTRDQIAAEALRSYAKAWARRDELGVRPVGEFAPYLQPNSYPSNIRGTLRDALSYLIVEQLANSSLWRADEANEVYRLDLNALLKNGTNAVLDGDAHPLAKLVTVLDDLERFHAKAGRTEAALEARLERLRRLRAAFTEKKDRARLEQELIDRLGKERTLPWWAMGQALLAGWARENDQPIRAHQLAMAGRDAYPSTMGGHACAVIAGDLEFPEYSLSAMGVDGINRASLVVQARNVEKLYFRAYLVDGRAHLEHTTNRTFNRYTKNELQKMVSGQKPSAAWEVALPATPDFRYHRTHVTPQHLPQHGSYVIVSSVRADFAEQQNFLAAVQVQISDLVMLVQEGGDHSTITVLDGTTGRLVEGATVERWKVDWRHPSSLIEAKRTDKKGEVRFDHDSNDDSILTASKGADFTLDENVLYLNPAARERTEVGTLIYTDRSVYRPGQKVAWKAVVYSGQRKQGRYQVSANRKITMWLRDANYQEVKKVEVTTNEFGSAHGEFEIPTGRLLGQWRLESSAPGIQMIRVEEYKRPTFEVTLAPPANALRLNETAKLTGEARYYFGTPVTAGQAKYTVVRAPQLPYWWSWYRHAPINTSTQTIARGASPIDAEGRFEVKFLPEAPADSALTYRYSINVDVTDEGGETRSATREYRLGKATIEASLATPLGFLSAGTPGTVIVRRADLDGTPRPGTGTWRVVRLDEPQRTLLPAETPAPPDNNETEGEAKTVTPGDRQKARYQVEYDFRRELALRTDGAEIAKGTIATNDQGAAELKLPALQGGAYRVRYQTTDGHGTKVEAFHDVVVSGGKPLHLPAVATIERSLVPVGEKVRILLETGLEDQTVLFETFREGERISRRVVDGKQGVIEIPMTEADRGGLMFQTTLVRDHQRIAIDLSVMVPWDNQSLKLSFSTFRDKLRPGAHETFRVTVDGEGNRKGRLGAGAAEILAYMYDRSLDVFAPHSPPSALSLFPYRASEATARASLHEVSQMDVSEYAIRSRTSFISPQPDTFHFEDGYPIGGMGMRGFGVGGGGGGGRAMHRRGKESTGSKQAPFGSADAPEPVALAYKDEDSKKEVLKSESTKLAVESGGGGADPTTLRSNFSETAFFAPSLLTNDKGEASFEFTVPDSVTSWNVWVHAITKDLRAGSINKETRSVKDLMVRPYLPRFFREGDEAQLKVVVNNTGSAKLDGNLTFDIIDPETKQSRIADFGAKRETRAIHVDAGKSTNLTFVVKAPRKIGTYAIVAQATAKAGNDTLSDGELRPVPVLPSRLHLTQSRFVTLRDTDKRTMHFDDLAKGGDASRANEQMVVTLDAQLFYTVLRALPYLVSYPYECAEQTLNRFVSTGIVTSLFAQHPAIAKMADQMSRRKTQLQAWDAGDANRKMGLEEAPFLWEAKGGSDNDGVLNVLDQRIAKANRDSALGKLQKMQHASGAFPWFPGGPPSPYMTLYVLMGMSRAAEFKVDVPKPLVQRAWRYLADHVRREYKDAIEKDGCCWEFLTLLNYVASSFPDASYSEGGLTGDERKKILDRTFQHWKDHAPYVKGLLSLTLQRAGRKADAKKVFDSVMDSAKTTRDEGTFWQPEDRSWLWYNDTIESHAFTLQVLMEVDPKNAKKDGLVLWLLLNKKLNQWKSTRATAEVLYSLAKYMQADGSLGVREAATVSLGTRQQTYTFEPDQYVGKVQMIVPGPEVSEKNATVTVEKKTKGVMFASATWSFATDQLPKEGRGDFFTVSRHYFLRENNGREFTLKLLAEGATVKAGDEVEVQLAISSKHAAEYVHLRDPRAAGFEPTSIASHYKYDTGLGYYEEVRDSGENFFFEQLPAGQYTFKYRVRATTGGTYRVGPATLQSMYAPEFNAYSAGHVMKIAGQ